jgi:hypothetical protein
MLTIYNKPVIIVIILCVPTFVIKIKIKEISIIKDYLFMIRTIKYL